MWDQIDTVSPENEMMWYPILASSNYRDDFVRDILVGLAVCIWSALTPAAYIGILRRFVGHNPSGEKPIAWPWLWCLGIISIPLTCVYVFQRIYDDVPDFSHAILSVICVAVMTITQVRMSRNPQLGQSAKVWIFGAMVPSLILACSLAALLMPLAGW